MDDLDVAINTYRMIVFNEDIDEISGDNWFAAFFFGKDSIDTCISIFEKYEHYEKCADLVELKKQL